MAEMSIKYLGLRMGSDRKCNPLVETLLQNFKFQHPEVNRFWISPNYHLKPRYIDSAGVQRVCGGSDLKGSQYYPKLLGHCVAQLYAKYAKEVQAGVKQQATLGVVPPL